MLKRLYIDNYRCFSNFEWLPDSLQLLAGRNGSGKTTIIELLWRLRSFLTGACAVETLFPAMSLTAWDLRPTQIFEMEIEADQATYAYRLEIEHDANRAKCRVARETLALDDTPLYEYKDNEARLHNDDGAPGPAFPADWSRSLIATLPERAGNAKVIAFRERVRRIFFFKIDPFRMTAHSDGEETEPAPDLSNLASWLRHLQAEDSGLSSRLEQSLKPLLPGLTRYGLKSVGEKERKLHYHFALADASTNEYALPFDDLSDGQRALSALYLILQAAIRPGTTVCIDEPDNFVALREMQPWIVEMQSRLEDTRCQCLIASHHPEFINYLTPLGNTVLFYRDSAGPVRSCAFDWSKPDAIAPAEVIARGWEES